MLDALGGRRRDGDVLRARGAGGGASGRCCARVLDGRARRRGARVRAPAAPGQRRARRWRADLDRALDALARAGVEPARWRIPWGHLADFTPQLARARGLSIVGWTRRHARLARRRRARRCSTRSSSTHGGIVLAHDGIGVGARRETARRDRGAGRPLVRASARAGTRTRSARRQLAGSDPGGESELPSRGSAARRDRPCRPRCARGDRRQRRGARSRSPPSPTPRSPRSETPARSTPPPTRAEEWGLVRAVAKADGSVGRIFEGHLNGYERLTLDGIDPQDHLLGVWGADPLPDEGTPAYVEDDALHGEKVFCSGAGGLDRALVIARGELVYVDLRRRRRDRPHVVPLRRDAGVGEPPRDLPRRAGPRDAQPARPRAVHQRRRDPHRGVLGGHPRLPRSRRRSTDLAAQARDRRPPGARRGTHARRAGRRSTAGSSTPRAASRPRRSRSSSGRRSPTPGATILDEAAARPAVTPVRDGHGAGPRPPRLRAVRAAAPARPVRGPARPRADRRAGGSAGRERTPAPRVLRRALRGRSGPVEVRDEPVRAGEVRRHDRRAGRPALRERARDRLLDRRAHASGSRRIVDDLLAIDVAEAALDRARARDSPNVAFERREVPEEFPDGAYDLIVFSEVLYYLDAPAFDATCDAIERTLDGILLAVHWRPERAALPAHRRRGPRRGSRDPLRPARLQPPRRASTTSTASTYAARDRRRRPRRARHRSRLPRGAAATATSRSSRPS